MKNLKALDFNLLKALEAQLDECNVILAPTHLGVTPPAMSGMLTRLRDNFGDPLCERPARHGTTPAQHLAAPLKRIISEIAALHQTPDFDPSAPGSASPLPPPNACCAPSRCPFCPG